jgi:hypothetical protein
MAQDTRIRRAKEALRRGENLAIQAREDIEHRSTATRAAYKHKALAAERALEILSERAK